MQIPEVQLWVHVWVDYNYKDNFYFCNLTKQGLPKIAAKLLGNPKAQLYSINMLACRIQDAFRMYGPFYIPAHSHPSTFTHWKNIQ
jgi:hypothetical protein